MAEFLIHESNSNGYSDGDIENVLLDIYSHDNSTELIENLLREKSSWAAYYHASPLRENILNWYSFDKNDDLLEVGAGCGALTGLFCKKTRTVQAIELSEKRSKIISERYKDIKNLEIIAADFQQFPFEKKFNYITCIGVLEYAKKYVASNNPYVSLLSKIKSLLKENGSLILAIENKFGLKYWAGAKEDHTGTFFDSIEGYPEERGIRTFGKNEIEKLLIDSGYSNIFFYYPMPDYKFPNEIFSDSYLPKKNHSLRQNFTVQDNFIQRVSLFNEGRVLNEIIQNDMFHFFANSFLIVAS